MNNLFKFSAAVLSLCFGVAACFSGCADRGRSTLLASPAERGAVTFEERRTEEFSDIRTGANAFAAKFSDEAYAAYSDGSNAAFAPVSVYMSLMLAGRCASWQTRSQIDEALGGGITLKGIEYLYASLNESYKTGKLTFGNSIWLQEGLEFIPECIDSLADEYYCYSYSADFRTDNEAANAAVRHFVREQTEGLIDCGFDLSQDTCFALVNALYLKDNWNLFGDELSLTDEKYDFVNAFGEVKNTRLMSAYYAEGRPQKGGNYTTFYAKTYNGCRLHFLLPDDGVAVGDVFTKSNISEVLAMSDYGGVDEAERVRYYTRCLFPAFESSFNGDVKPVLERSFGITDLFDRDICDLSSILPGGVNDYGYRAFCTKVQHVTKLSVDRRGIEGAAVTVIPADAATSAEPWEEIRADFVIDGAFGYILTDSRGTVLFTGVVNDI